jgi:hypothetical protein
MLASHMDLVFHLNEAGQALLEAYGGGENGLELFLKSAVAAIHASVPLATEEADFVDGVLAGAWKLASAIGPVDTWPSWFQSNVLTFDTASWNTLEGLPSPFGSAAPLSIGPVRCADPDALFALPEQTYTQVVELGGGPVARSLLPPGTSEHSGSHGIDQIPLWEADETKPSPRTPAEVQATGPFTQTTLKYSAPAQ